MSFPGAVLYPLVTSDCNGQFLRHFTFVKDKVKPSVENAVLQTLTEAMQKAFLQNRDELWMKEPQELLKLVDG